MPRGPCAHTNALSPTSKNTWPLPLSLASSSPSKGPPVKVAGSLEAENHLHLPGFGLHKSTAEDSCVDWDLSPKLAGRPSQHHNHLPPPDKRSQPK